MSFIETILSKAKKAEKHIIFPEGMDPRVVKAAYKLIQDKICTVTLLATSDEIEESCRKAEISLKDLPVDVIDYTTAPIGEKLAEAFYERRKARGMTREEAIKWIRTKRLYFGAMMLSTGMVDGLVAGSVAYCRYAAISFSLRWNYREHQTCQFMFYNGLERKDPYRR